VNRYDRYDLSRFGSAGASKAGLPIEPGGDLWFNYYGEHGAVEAPDKDD
jgi:hypothetical protein